MRSRSVRLRQASGTTGGKGIRTPDLLIANETLYQLSYTPKRRANYRGETIFRQAIPKIVSNPICYYLSVDGKRAREIRRLRILRAR